MLHALAVLATSSIQCERKALFAILHATKKHNLEIPLVTKVSKASHWYTDYCFPYKFYIYQRFESLCHTFLNMLKVVPFLMIVLTILEA